MKARLLATTLLVAIAGVCTQARADEPAAIYLKPAFHEGERYANVFSRDRLRRQGFRR